MSMSKRGLEADSFPIARGGALIFTGIEQRGALVEAKIGIIGLQGMSLWYEALASSNLFAANWLFARPAKASGKSGSRAYAF
jgi:hypothetical protein